MLMSSNRGPAKLYYMQGTFRVLSSGDHVVCAVTGQSIALDQLRYWSVDRQEPYASASASLEAEQRK